jgi:UDP-N-acetylglucosamine/UDP-N-acetylgalactosamine 4-epimerase
MALTRKINRKKKLTRRRRLYGGGAYDGLSILVTGGAGFIGSNIVDALLAAGAAKVRVLDNLATGKEANLEKAKESGARFEFVKGDVTNPSDCEKACAGMNVVFHEAALVSVPVSVYEPTKNNDINITGTLNMMIAAAKAGVTRFVYASSAATYGALPELPKREDQPRDYPSPYALSKGVDEDYAHLFARDTDGLIGSFKPKDPANPTAEERAIMEKDKRYNASADKKAMTCVGLRYFNVYGPRQDPTSAYSGVISIFADRIKKGNKITFNGDGKNTRDFVFVGDVVQANLLSGIKPLPDGQKSSVFNVGTGVAVTLLELKDTIQKIVGKEVEFAFGPARAGDIVHSLSDITKIKNDLGYEPKFNLEQGLTLLLDSIKTD